MFKKLTLFARTILTLYIGWSWAHRCTQATYKYYQFNSNLISKHSIIILQVLILFKLHDTPRLTTMLNSFLTYQVWHESLDGISWPTSYVVLSTKHTGQGKLGQPIFSLSTSWLYIQLVFVIRVLHINIIASLCNTCKKLPKFNCICPKYSIRQLAY